MRRKIRLFGLLVVLVIIAVPLTGFWVAGYLHRPLPMNEPVTVIVDPGVTYSGMLHTMKERGLLGRGINEPLRWGAARLYALFTGVDAHMFVGEYRLTPGDGLITLLDKVDRGDVLQHTVTLVDGWTFKEWRSRLDGLADLKHATQGLSGQQIMARLGMPDHKPEGWFAPNTYFYTRGTSDLDVMRRALDRQRRILDDAWSERDNGLPYDSSYQALIMASIVEKETAVPNERGTIAGVFINRLRRGMRLQTDPTVIYGLGERYDGNLHRSDLRRRTPYNTYLISGLPPTPIAMPGKEAIQAALHPSDTEALYFVARGDGSHVFSNSLAAHQKAVRKYQLKRRSDYRSTPRPLSQPETPARVDAEAAQ